MRLNSIELLAKLAGFGSLMLLCACSPKSNSSTVQIGFPDWKQLQAATYAQQSANSTPAASSTAGRVSIISINTSLNGSGTKVVYSWQRQNDAQVAPTSAPSFSIDKGSLVQVLAVVDGGTATQFYYADAMVPLSSPDDLSLDMTLTNVAATQGLVEGNVIGRYLTAANAGPTGIFQYRYQPDSRPSMIVTTGEVFSGWMNTFSLSSTLIQYTWPDGTPAFGFTANDNSMQSKTNPMRSARIFVPGGFENDNNSGTYNMQGSPAKLITAGFFGPYADAAYTASPIKLCLSTPTSTSSASAIAGLYATADASNPAATPSNQMVWIGKLTPDAATQQAFVLNPSTSTDTGYTKGGDDSGTCGTSGTKYVDYMTFDGTQLKSSDSVLGFRGPFAALSANKYLTASYNTSTLAMDLGWAFLPGATAQLGGLSIFYRAMPSGSSDDNAIRTNNGYRCADFHTNTGITDGPAFSELSVGTGTTSASIPNVTATMASQLQIVVCPRALDGATYFTSAITNQSSGSVGGTATATQLIASDLSHVVGVSGSLQKAEIGACTPILVTAADGSGNAGFVALSRTLNVSASDATYDHVYTDPNCSGTPTNPITVTNFWGRQVVYVKTSRSTPSSGSVVVSDTTGSNTLTSGQTMLNYVASGTVPTILAAIVPSTLMAYQCVPISYQLQAADGTPANVTSGSASFTLPTSANLFLYTDPICSSSASGLFFSGTPGTTTSSLYMIYRASSGSSLAVGATGTSGGATAVAKSVPLTQPGAAVRVGVSLPITFAAQTCQLATVSSQDSNGNSSPAASTLNVTLAPAAGGFFTSQSACDLAASDTAGAITSVSIASGSTTTSSPLYYRVDTPQAGLAIMASATGLQSTTLGSIVVTAPVLNRIVIQFPGQQMDGSYNITGSPSMILVGSTATANLYALSEVNQLITNFNATIATLNLTYPSSYMGTPTLNWAGGIGTFAAAATAEGASLSLTLGGVTGINYSFSSNFNIGTPSLVVASRPTTNVPASVCSPVLVTAVASQSSGAILSSFTVPAPVTIGMFTDSGHLAYYTDPGCSTSYTSSSMSTGASAMLLYVKPTLSSGPMYLQVLSVAGYQDPSTNLTYQSAQTAGAPANLATIGSGSFHVGSCQAFAATIVDSFGYASVATAATTVSIYATGIHSTTYSDPSCTTATTTVNVPIGQNAGIFYVLSTAPDSGTIGAYGITPSLGTSGTVTETTTY